MGGVGVKASVGVLIYRADEVLLMLRRAGNAFGTWAAPGGKVDAGETCAAAAVREVAEETGLGVQVAPLGTWTDFAGRDCDYVILWYVATSWRGVPVVREPEKCERLRWCPMNALPSPLAPFMREGIGALRRWAGRPAETY
jgi:8-oxo-dGTP diphosphatase